MSNPGDFRRAGSSAGRDHGAEAIGERLQGRDRIRAGSSAAVAAATRELSSGSGGCAASRDPI